MTLKLNKKIKVSTQSVLEAKEAAE